MLYIGYIDRVHWSTLILSDLESFQRQQRNNHPFEKENKHDLLNWREGYQDSQQDHSTNKLEGLGYI